jgi:hypothetical protein
MPNYVAINFSQIELGMELSLYWPGNGGVGGTVEALSADGLTIVGGTARVVREYTVAQLLGANISQEVAYDRSECIEFGDTCKGPVDDYSSRSGMTSAKRCDGHWFAHCDRLNAISRDYPDSPSAPSWFDPSYAGESWDEDY